MLHIMREQAEIVQMETAVAAVADEQTESSFVRRYKESNFRISLGSENQYDFNNNYINNFSNQINLPSSNFQLNLTYKFN